MCCVCVRMRCVRTCWWTDADDCKRKEKKTGRKKSKLTKYKSCAQICVRTRCMCVQTRMNADDVDADADGGGE